MGSYSFLSKVNGILPGYGGFRPGNRRLSFKTGFGGVPKPAGTTRFKPDGTDLGPGGWVRAPRPQFGGQGQHPPPTFGTDFSVPNVRTSTAGDFWYRFLHTKSQDQHRR